MEVIQPTVMRKGKRRWRYLGLILEIKLTGLVTNWTARRRGTPGCHQVSGLGECLESERQVRQRKNQLHDAEHITGSDGSRCHSENLLRMAFMKIWI